MTAKHACFVNFAGCWLHVTYRRAHPPPALPRLSFLGIAGREINEKWDDKGAGAVFFLQQEMSDAVTGGAGRKLGSLPRWGCLLMTPCLLSPPTSCHVN